MAAASAARAGVWGAEPVLGLSGDYSSNPALLAGVPDTAESHAALLLDAPTTYVGEAVKLSLEPQIRLSNSQGYAATDSDYAHLNLKSEFDTERSVFSAAVGAARDSSLYHDVEFNGSTGVRRDGATADLNWDRQLAERIDWDTDLSASRVRYGESTGLATLTDYKYASLSPTVAWAASERTKYTIAASAGRYDSLDGSTASTSYNAQFGLQRQLSELWSVTGSAGYSRAFNRADAFSEALVFSGGVPEIEIVPQTEKSTQNGTVFAVNLTRQSSLLTLNVLASRQLTPTGFAYLTRQDTYDLKSAYQAGPRWSFSADLRWVEYRYPELLQNSIIGQQWGDFALNATWLWTEQWTITLSASRIVTHGTSVGSVAANGCSLVLSRHFNWKKFQ